MKAYILKRDYEHLCDMSYDISLIPFSNSEDLKYQLLSNEKLTLTKPVEFLANFNVVKNESDYPIVDYDIEVMSDEMVNVLKKVGQFSHILYPTLIVDDTFLKNKYDSEGNLLPDVPLLKNFNIVQLLDILQVFDFEKSEFKPLRSNPKFPGIVKKMVIKEPVKGLPPIFRMLEKPASVFLSEAAKQALEANNIKGCVFEEVEVTPYEG